MSPTSRTISEILKAAPLFAILSDSELAFVATRSIPQTKPAGTFLFSEGDPCNGLYVVASGRVRILKTSAGGREQVLSVEGPGASIAELPVFDGGAYPASASVMVDSEVVFVSRALFHSLCLEHPEVAVKVLQVVGGRLRRLVGIIEELSFATVRHRLISWLLRQADLAGGPTFTLAATQQELAAQIGTVRELVSRNMARLQAQEFIEVNGRQVTIVDRAGLEADLASA